MQGCGIDSGPRKWTKDPNRGWKSKAEHEDAKVLKNASQDSDPLAETRDFS